MAAAAGGGADTGAGADAAACGCDCGCAPSCSGFFPGQPATTTAMTTTPDSRMVILIMAIPNSVMNNGPVFRFHRDIMRCFARERPVPVLVWLELNGRYASCELTGIGVNRAALVRKAGVVASSRVFRDVEPSLSNNGPAAEGCRYGRPDRTVEGSRLRRGGLPHLRLALASCMRNAFRSSLRATDWKLHGRPGSSEVIVRIADQNHFTRPFTDLVVETTLGSLYPRTPLSISRSSKQRGSLRIPLPASARGVAYGNWRYARQIPIETFRRAA